jgi:pimeloyl-ACP methyl ester carboxylesterase
MRTSKFTSAVRIVVILLVALTGAASSAGAAVLHKAGDVLLDPPGTVTIEGASVRYETGTLFVPENRESATSRIIGIGFARIKAPRPTGAPPVFWLPGGPGLSVLGAFGSDSAEARSRLKHWASFGAVGDLVVVEQRGYSIRGDMLTHPTQASPLDLPSSVQADARQTIALAKAAVAANPDKDLAGYTIVQLAADVDDLRKALGYEKISLFGGSFGSQWSLALIRLYPQAVARAVLSAVEPLDGYDIPSQIVSALQRMAYDADRDPGLAPYLPEGGMMAAITEIRERLAAETLHVTISDDKARNAMTVALGPEDFQMALLTHVSDGVDWPAFILSIYHRHYDAWARDVIEGRQVGQQTLIRPLIDTSLGVTAERLHRLRTDPSTSVVGTWAFEIDVASAAAWPTPDLGDALRVAVPSAVPVLFVHGDWDVSTPIENPLSLLPYFPNGHVIQVHRGGHDGTFYQLREHPEVKAAVYEFLRIGRMHNLPVSVSLSLPRFTRPAFPAPVSTMSKP